MLLSRLRCNRTRPVSSTTVEAALHQRVFVEAVRVVVVVASSMLESWRRGTPARMGSLPMQLAEADRAFEAALRVSPTAYPLALSRVT